MNCYRVTFYNVDLRKAATWVEAYNDQHAIMVATAEAVHRMGNHPTCIHDWIEDKQIHNVHAVIETN